MSSSDVSSFKELLGFLKHENNVMKANSLKILLQFLGNDVFIRHLRNESIESVSDIVKTVKIQNLDLLALPVLSIISRDSQLCDKIFYSNRWFLGYVMDKHTKNHLDQSYQKKNEVFIAVLLANLTSSPGGCKLFLEKEIEDCDSKLLTSEYFSAVLRDILFSRPGLFCPYFLNVIINSTSYSEKCRIDLLQSTRERERDEIVDRILKLFEKLKSDDQKNDAFVRLSGFCNIFKNLALEEKYLACFEKIRLVTVFVPILKSLEKKKLKSDSNRESFMKTVLEILFALTKNFSLMKQVNEEKEYFEYLVKEHWDDDLDEMNEKNPLEAELKLITMSIIDVLLMNQSVMSFEEGKIIKMDQ